MRRYGEKTERCSRQNLDGMFLVYAAADRPEINRQVTDWGPAAEHSVRIGNDAAAGFFLQHGVSLLWQADSRLSAAGSPMADGQFLDQIEPLMKAQNQRLTWLETLRSRGGKR